MWGFPRETPGIPHRNETTETRAPSDRSRIDLKGFPIETNQRYYSRGNPRDSPLFDRKEEKQVPDRDPADLDAQSLDPYHKRVAVLIRLSKTVRLIRTGAQLIM